MYQWDGCALCLLGISDEKLCFFILCTMFGLELILYLRSCLLGACVDGLFFRLRRNYMLLINVSIYFGTMPVQG